jgi:hypothetical protein
MPKKNPILFVQRKGQNYCNVIEKIKQLLIYHILLSAVNNSGQFLISFF